MMPAYDSFEETLQQMRTTSFSIYIIVTHTDNTVQFHQYTAQHQTSQYTD